MTSPSLVILGTDAVLAAAPATPVQLAHACLAAGYGAAVPASWGDELLAHHAIEALKITNAPLVLCSCPLVAARLVAHGGDIAPMTLCAAAPPAATAAYVRALYAPGSVHLTYVGSCPGGRDPGLDAWFTPGEFLGQLERRGIALAAQPTEFDSVLPPDRRRYYSEPGGAPTPGLTRALSDGGEVVTVRREDFAIELAQHLLSPSRVLVDVAVGLGCACAGGSADLAPDAARARVQALEPPRALGPVVDHDVSLSLGAALPTAAPPFTMPDSPTPVTGSPREPDPAVLQAARFSAAAQPDASVAVVDAGRRRSSPSTSTRAVLGTMPQSRTAGRQLPRAYVARRRSSPKGVRQSGIRRQEEVLGVRARFSRRWIWIGGVGAAAAATALWILRVLF